jgi:hypothetical protein
MDESSASVPPEVPSPLLVASWERLGLLPTERVPLWAAYWIAGGHDSEALAYLAGLHGDDPHDVHEALPQALLDCGVEMPDSDFAAATVAFTHIARLHVNGLTGPLWVAQKVDQIVVKSGYSARVMDLPLGKLYGVEEEWSERWGRSHNDLAPVIREACEEQLHSCSAG